MNRSELKRGPCSGFTLVEALVALVIVSLGMMAVITQINQYAMNSAYIEQKTLASWIATNVLTEISVAPQWPEIGDDEDEVEFAGREWHYRVEVSETEVPNLRRVDVSVAPGEDPDRVVHTVSALVEPPTPRGFVPLRWLPLGGPEGGRG